jgi:DNA replication protein DnaC
MKQDLTLLDEVGFVPFSIQGGQLLFQFCSERYQRGSMILTTNLEFPRWTEVFGDPDLTSALLDRITQHCHTPALECGTSVVECHGDSYRFKQSLKKRHAVT